MEFLSAQARQIAQQLRTMSVSQRIALFLLLIVVAGGMWSLVRWGAEPDWAPLLDQAFNPTEIQRVQAELRVAGVPSRVEGDRVLIRGGEDERQRLQAVLSERGALPADTSLGYAALVRENSVFISEQRSRWLECRGLEAELSAVLRRFKGVRDARVLVTIPQKRGFSRVESAAGASVALTLEAGQELDAQRVLAIANFVSGAVPGLDLSAVKITDGKRFYRPPDDREQMPTELLEQQRRIEDHYMQKVYDQLRHIDGVVVNVHAWLRSASQKSQQEVYGPPVVQRETSTTEETTSAGRSAEPAVRPNTRAGVSDAGSGASSVREENDTTYSERRDVKTTIVDELRGSVEKLAASVSVPRSYLARIATSAAPGMEKIEDAAIEKIAGVELPRIKSLVRPLLGAVAEDQVAVDWYFDPPETSGPAAAEEEESLASTALAYAPKALLGLLAATSLFFVLRMARQAQSAMSPSVRAAEGRAGKPASGEEATTLQAASTGVAGDVGDGATPGGPAGPELDENTRRSQQIVKQIGQMVREDPRAVATIVEQWVQESE